MNTVMHSAVCVESHCGSVLGSLQGEVYQRDGARDAAADGGQPEAGADLHLPGGGLQRARPGGELRVHPPDHQTRA